MDLFRLNQLKPLNCLLTFFTLLLTGQLDVVTTIELNLPARLDRSP